MTTTALINKIAQLERALELSIEADVNTKEYNRDDVKEFYIKEAAKELKPKESQFDSALYQLVREDYESWGP